MTSVGRRSSADRLDQLARIWFAHDPDAPATTAGDDDGLPTTDPTHPPLERSTP